MEPRGKTGGGGNSEPPTCPQSVGGFHLILGEAGFAGNILQGILPITTLPGKHMQGREGLQHFASDHPCFEGVFFFGLSCQQFWQEASQARSWQL